MVKIIKTRTQMQHNLNLVAEWGDYLPDIINLYHNGGFVQYKKTSQIDKIDRDEMIKADNCGHGVD